MAKAQPVEIAGHTFKDKTDARAFMRAMLNRYRPGDTVAAADATFLIAALQFHPEARSKIGSCPERFEIRSAD